MSRQIYGHGSTYGGLGDSYRSSYGGGAAASSIYTYRESPRLPSVEPFSAPEATSLYPDHLSSIYSKQGISASTSYPSAASLYGTSAYDPSLVAGTKRSIEALYHQTILGSHNNIGQTEALFSSNSLIKRPRLETGSNLPIYPQRPGEKDCAYYMMTRTCKFGEACKFDHPIWVPEGGIPDWKEIPLVPTTEALPERPGEPDCPYYLKTQKCKFGFRCKFNHPKENFNGSADEPGAVGPESVDISILPERPSEPICSFYMKTGNCKFGANCKFNHPKDLQLSSNEQDSGKNGLQEPAGQDGRASGDDSKSTKVYVPFTPALLHNSKGLPIRPGEPDCPFYLKTGSCKYSSTCRFNHPDRNAINSQILAAGLGQSILPAAASNLSFGVLNPAATFLQNIDLQSAQASLGIIPTIYPQRPGELECDFYMKTGHCKFGERCKFHHPIDRSAPTSVANQAPQQSVKLTLAGLPRREGAVICSFYMKTGTCKFGAACKFDHPPPGEVMAMASTQGTDGTAVSTAEGVEHKD
ncbi:zinc finger CCCH domain-containing protein 37 isoform X2 [Canna indica]|uniref:Zinc finger CCCH domain-containing protein 37 isoform X2 n=1 Tax=Canna indica TaxID=4628 RepID=A0AAQ3Q2Q3_9LILI|nr:zinc finger CCCH domain-containing protein 37 isoform X2 [Canna indica]